MTFWNGIRWALIGNLGKALLWIWAKTARIKTSGGEAYLKLHGERKPVIFLVWHGRLFLAPYYFRRRGIMPLISPSRDGEFVAQIVRRWGYKVSRGSSSHSIIRAWFEMKKELESGGEVLIVPDGPRGPSRVLKLGCLKLAQQTGAVLVPFTFSSSRRRIFKSWDSFMIFPPFSRVSVRVGEPLTVDPALEGDALEIERKRIEAVLIRFDNEADADFPASR